MTPHPTWPSPLQRGRHTHTPHGGPWGRGLALGGALCAALLAPLVAPASAHAADMVSVRGPVLNMRAGPGTQHEVLWQLQRGYPLQVIQRQGKWLKIRDFENDTGWVAQSLTSRSPHHIVKARVANLRSGPSTRYRVLGQARYGDLLRTLDKRAAWVRVERENGAKGWVSRALLWGW